MQVVDVFEGSAFVFDEQYALELPGWAAKAIEERDWRPLGERVVDTCTKAVFAENQHDLTFIEALSDSVNENAEALREVLMGRLTIDDVPLVYRLRFAALEAELRIPQASLQRSYRISFFLQWQDWSLVVADAAAENDVSREEAVCAQGSLASMVHAYSDAVIANVAASFARSEDAFNRSRAHVRQRLVRELLEGNDEALSPADVLTLDYSLNSSHLALLLPRTPQGAAAQLMIGLRSAVRPTHHLIYPLGLGSSVIWLASSSPWNEERTGRVVAALDDAGVVACLSEAASGLLGFVSTYEQARSVERLRSATEDQESGVTRHCDMRLEILLMQSPELAEVFLRQELGPLAEDTSEAAKLRATLEASFRLGSHVAAAEHLALHEHTVRNRLQKATEMLGPLNERRTEIQVALRLWRILSAVRD